MKTKYIIAIGALGSTLGIGLTCVALTNEPTPWEAPAAPTTVVWDGSEYVGQVDGKLYYLDSDNSWLALDKTRQQRFDQWANNHGGGTNAVEQSNQPGSTRSQGAAKGENAIEQSSSMQNTGSNPNGESSGIRNTRYEGHDMGQTRAFAPPLETH